MGQIVNIIGEGNVEVRATGTVATLSASADDLYRFKHFLFDNEVKTDNPIEIDETDLDKVTAVFCVTIETYLMGLVGFEVTEIAINSIRIDRDIKKGCDVKDLSEKIRELAYADLLMWAATNTTSYQGAKTSDDGWTHTEASKTISVTDKKDFRRQAMEIYKKYDDARYNTKIKIVNLY